MDNLISIYQFEKMPKEQQEEIKLKILQYLKSLIDHSNNIAKIEKVASKALNISKKIICDVTSSKEFKNYLAYKKMQSIRQSGSYFGSRYR